MLCARIVRGATALALAGGVNAAAAGCGAPAWGAVAGLEHSQWQEYAADGSRLLRERGDLALAGLQFDIECEGLQWSAQWLRSQGERSYDGRTNAGVPFQSQTRVRLERLQLQAWWPLQPSWALGARLRQQTLEREIAGRGAVLGYPERYRYWQASIGLRHRQVLASHLDWHVALWLGAGPKGSVRVELPGYDPAVLDLGRSRVLSLELGLQGGARAEQTGWTWNALLAYGREATSAGPNTLLTRLGRPVGASARQPRFAQQQWQFRAGAAYRF
ncbi:hypothetical protein [Comamonas sp. NLF-1-9]|uniref:hypothetical protein n=1 Tax=Comamonas sp. NLF-1-9 TaxID=2853163 RepID=UPI001C48B60E|nr:hypothetical protein [Comamonas sp. NLF-1-9]QXL84483.1 hypothetical protein KUD94_00320 [Comamonas sp. NLF-1-9]